MLNRRTFIGCLGTTTSWTAPIHPWDCLNQACRDSPDMVAAEPYAIHEPTAIVRRSTASFAPDTSSELCEKLGNSYDQMKKIGPVGPHSLLDRQARLHAWYCDVGGIHRSFYFLLWHRGLVYFHERMLRRLSGDDNLRLPYWDWTVRSCESFYKPGTALARPGNPATFSASTKGLLDKDKTAANDALKFGGYENFHETFRKVHGDVHLQALGLMPNLRKAAWDPLFYGHHGNCDRYFAIWQNTYMPDLQSSIWTVEPSINLETDWLYFLDETGKPVKLLPKDLWNIEKLGYKYDDTTEPTETHTNPSEGPSITIQSSLSVPTLDALNGPHQAVWADLSPLAAGTKAAQSRLVFVLNNKTDRLPSDAAELYKDNRFLGQFTQDQKLEKQNHSHRSWTVDASKTLRHFIKSGDPNEKVWLATVDLDPSGKPGKQRLLKADTRVKLRYYKVESRPPRPR